MKRTKKDEQIEGNNKEGSTDGSIEGTNKQIKGAKKKGKRNGWMEGRNLRGKKVPTKEGQMNR